MWIGDSAATVHMWAIDWASGAGLNPRVFIYASKGNFSSAQTTTNASQDTWHHLCGVFAASDDRTAYLDGGNKGTDATDLSPDYVDLTAIGAFKDNTPGEYCSGRIAEAAIWNVALTDAEVAILADGFSPLLVRPASLVAYWPLIGRYSPEIDIRRKSTSWAATI